MGVRHGRQNRRPARAAASAGASPQARAPRVEVILSDDWLIVANKPAGMLVNMSEKGEPTLQDLLRRQLPPSIRPDATPPAAVHRIDRYTSGLVLFGRTVGALERMSEELREGGIRKTYLALVIGHPGEEEHEWTIDIPLREVPDPKRRMSIARPGQDGALESLTKVRVLELFPGGQSGVKCAMIEAQPLTGRTHQIRVHLAAAGFPVAGDKVHGEKSANRALRERCGLERQFLHARSLAFPHPESGRLVAADVRVPLELSDVVGKIRQELDAELEARPGQYNQRPFDPDRRPPPGRYAPPGQRRDGPRSGPRHSGRGRD